MPFPIRMIRNWMNPFFADLTREHWTKSVPPITDRFVTNIPHRDMRLDCFVIDQPNQCRCGAISCVSGKTVRLQAEARLGALNHCFCSFDLFSPACRCRLAVNDDANLQINQIISRITDDPVAQSSLNQSCKTTDPDHLIDVPSYLSLPFFT